MSTTQVVILVVVIVVIVFGSVVGLGMLLTGVAVREGNEVRDRFGCMNNLKALGELLMARKAGRGKLRPLEGAAYVLQVAPDVNDEDLDVFLCPGAPGADELGADFADAIRKLRPEHAGRLCSYRGPDQTALAAWKKANPGKRAIVACCAQGDDGLLPYHGDGICVLYETGKVEFIPGPVQVGPDSPDPRFRHLVR